MIAFLTLFDVMFLMSKEDSVLIHESIPAKTLKEHVQDLLVLKRGYDRLGREKKEIESDMRDAEETVLATEMCERDVNSLRELPANIYYEFPDGAILELRANDTEAVSIEYDEATIKIIKEYEETIKATKKEIEIAKLKGKKTEERHPVRTWQVWLKEPKVEIINGEFVKVAKKPSTKTKKSSKKAPRKKSLTKIGDEHD